MDEKVIGLVYRFGRNDYQISLMEFDEADQAVLMEMEEKYSDNCSCERGNIYMTLKDANIEYLEHSIALKEIGDKRKELAEKLYSIDYRYHIYDDLDEGVHMTTEDFIGQLETYKGTANVLETFMQACYNENETNVFETCMDIVRYMEMLGDKGEN